MFNNAELSMIYEALEITYNSMDRPEPGTPEALEALMNKTRGLMADADAPGGRLDSWQAIDPYVTPAVTGSTFAARVQYLAGPDGFTSWAATCEHEHGTHGEAHSCAIRLAMQLNANDA